jgi:hypothetical protein
VKHGHRLVVQAEASGESEATRAPAAGPVLHVGAQSQAAEAQALAEGGSQGPPVYASSQSAGMTADEAGVASSGGLLGPRDFTIPVSPQWELGTTRTCVGSERLNDAEA